jgi:hypothetical protein
MVGLDPWDLEEFGDVLTMVAKGSHGQGFISLVSDYLGSY